MKEGDSYKVHFTVGDDVFNGFRTTFKQENPFHTDDAICIERGYRAKIMPGNMQSGFVSEFVGEHLPLKDVLFHSLNISFLLPVYLYDELDLFAEITYYSESIPVYELKGYFKNQDGKKTAKFTIQLGIIKPAEG
jgi:3-hydroxybutyryl-CoA dehydratase